MATFQFEAIPSGPVLALDGADIIVFPTGAALASSVTFNAAAGGPATISVAFAGHEATFDLGLVAVSANHNLHFSDGSTLLIGGAGADRLTIAAGGGAAFGGPGDDIFDTSAALNSPSVVQGNQGDDTVTGGIGPDTIFGGQGNDLIMAGGDPDDTDFHLGLNQSNFAQGNLGDDTIIGGEHADTLLGGQGDDRIFGVGGQDVLDGNLGNDVVETNGPAQMFGEAGNDTLIADGLGEVMSGGPGADLFVFDLFAFAKPLPIDGPEATITDWAGDDRISVLNLGPGAPYQETTAADFASALAAANTVFHGGGGGVVVVQVGPDLLAFFDNVPGGAGEADVAIRIAGRTLADIDAGAFG